MPTPRPWPPVACGARKALLKAPGAAHMDRHMLQLLDRTVHALGSEGAASEVIKVDVGTIYTGSFGTRYFPKGASPHQHVERNVTYAADSGTVSLEIDGATFTGVVPSSAVRGVNPRWSLRTVETVGAGKRVLAFERLGNLDVRFKLTET